MTLTCISPFGRFVPGDEIDVPDGAVFDTAYFAAKAPAVKRSDASPEENKE